MKKQRKTLKLIVACVCGVLVALSATINFGLLFADPIMIQPAAGSPPVAPTVAKRGDEQMAYLLVKLLLATRKEMAGHFGRKQSPIPAVDKLYQRMLVKNLILPAAVADHVFYETVPHATGGRAWVKMIVDEPRNPHNRGDDAAVALLADLRAGASTAEQKTAAAYYYGEPIKAKRACLYCHGEPRGAPDPFFDQYTKEGWREGDLIGAVVARVAPESSAGG